MRCSLDLASTTVTLYAPISVSQYSVCKTKELLVAKSQSYNAILTTWSVLVSIRHRPEVSPESTSASGRNMGSPCSHSWYTHPQRHKRPECLIRVSCSCFFEYTEIDKWGLSLQSGLARTTQHIARLQLWSFSDQLSQTWTLVGIPWSEIVLDKQSKSSRITYQQGCLYVQGLTEFCP